MSDSICGPAPSAYYVIKEDVGEERWCFGERKRRTGRHILTGVTTEYLEHTLAYGWAEPFWSYHCDGCGEDRRAGFGGEWGEE